METNLHEIQKMLEPIQAFILDMDGTIYLGDQLFPYTHSFLKKIKATNREYFFFTNNSSKNVEDYEYKLKNMSIQVKKSQIMISTHVLLRHLEQHHKGQRVYVVGTNELQKEFEQHGWLLDDKNPDIVVLGFDTTLTYQKLCTACSFLRHGVVYYGINPDLNCPMEGGEYIPDCGSMAKLIEASTQRYPEFFGKPSSYARTYMLQHTGLAEEQIAVIGDRLYTDIAVACNSSILSILVLCGETKAEDVKGSKVKPDIVIEDIGQLIDLL